jgi:hypothetical protein
MVINPKVSNPINSIATSASLATLSMSNPPAGSLEESSVGWQASSVHCQFPWTHVQVLQPSSAGMLAPSVQAGAGSSVV